MGGKGSSAASATCSCRGLVVARLVVYSRPPTATERHASSSPGAEHVLSREAQGAAL